MRRTAALTGVLGAGFRAAPRFMLFTTGFATVGAVASATFPVGFWLMTDAVQSHRVDLLVLGAAIASVLYAVNWATMSVAAVEGVALTDRVLLMLCSRLVQAVGGIADLRRVESADVQRTVGMIEENRSVLASGPRRAVELGQVVITMALVAALLSSIDPVLGAVPVVMVPVVVADRWAVRIRERSRGRSAARRQRTKEVFSIASSPDSAAEIRIFGTGPVLRERFRRDADVMERAARRSAGLAALVSGGGWALYAVGLTATVTVVAWHAVAGTASIGQVVLATTLVRRAQIQTAKASEGVGQFLTAVSLFRQLIGLEAITGPIGTQRPVAAELPDRLSSGIELRGVTVRYPAATRDALHDVSLSLPAGSTVALVGENGAGKSSLVRVLLGLHPPDRGSVLVDGRALDGGVRAGWQWRAAAAFQDFLTPQVQAGVAVGIGDLTNENEDAVGAALAAAGAPGLLAELPQGSETRLGESFTDGVHLSRGQWQKLALGRAMMREFPLLVVLDEPAASLDAAAENRLYTRYVDVAREASSRAGAVTVLVTHRLAAVQAVDLVVLLEDGRVSECGDHDTLVARPGPYRDLFRVQAEMYT